MASVSKKRVGKKKTKKTTTKKKGTTKIKYESTKEIKVEKALVDNFVALQKIMVNLSSKFDNLSMQISKLLDLFEISAKSLAQKDTTSEKENKDNKKILDKLENISSQAGLIGRGLTLIHQVNAEGSGRPVEEHFVPPKQPMPRQAAPPGQNISPPGAPQKNMQGYQRSISSRIPEDHA